MDTGTLVGIIGIVVTLFGLFLAKNIMKNRRSQNNKIVIKSKGNSTFRDIVGGEKITHENNTESPK